VVFYAFDEFLKAVFEEVQVRVPVYFQSELRDLVGKSLIGLMIAAIWVANFSATFLIFGALPQ